MGERGEGRGGGEEAACQIAFADQIIVNKVDRLGRRGPPPDHRPRRRRRMRCEQRRRRYGGRFLFGRGGDGDRRVSDVTDQKYQLDGAREDNNVLEGGGWRVEGGGWRVEDLS